jgi:hypothetical protein
MSTCKCWICAEIAFRRDPIENWHRMKIEDGPYSAQTQRHCHVYTTSLLNNTLYLLDAPRSIILLSQCTWLYYALFIPFHFHHIFQDSGLPLSDLWFVYIHIMWIPGHIMAICATKMAKYQGIQCHGSQDHRPFGPHHAQETINAPFQSKRCNQLEDCVPKCAANQSKI